MQQPYVPKATKRKGMTMATKNAISGYLFIMPFIIGFLAFMARPLYQTIRMVFSDVRLDLVESTFSYSWIGLENLRRALFIDPNFTRYVTEELAAMAMLVIPVIIFSLFIATLLNRKFVGRGFVRAVFFLPVILASGVLVGIETNNTMLEAVATQIQEANAMRTQVTGFIETLLVNQFGTATATDTFVEFLLDLINHIYTIVMASGIPIIIFLAGLQTIPTSIYEASSIEGATGWENFWKITFPMISPMILVSLVYAVIDFMVRTDSMVMIRIEMYVNRIRDFGFGSAMAMIYFVVIAGVLALATLITSRMVYYYDK